LSKKLIDIGFTLKEEALNTSDNYYSRSWMEDKRSNLRHKGITFVQSGELSNKMPTPSQSENEELSSHSNVPEIQDTVVSATEETIVQGDEPSSLQSTDHTEPTTEEPSVENDNAFRPRTNSSNSISRFHGTDSEANISESASISNRNFKPNLPSSYIPLPPVQFISTEENIVFTPRNQRKQRNCPPQNLTNWEVPADFKAMTESTAPDWTKPRKKVNRKGGHKQYCHDQLEGGEEIEFLSPVYGLPMTTTAEDALMDYLENIHAQGEESEGDEDYADRVLVKEEDVGEGAMEELSLDDKRRSRSVEKRNIPNRPFGIPRSFALSESATPLRMDSPEGRGPVNSAIDSDVSEKERIVNRVPPVVHSGNPDEDDAWILNPMSSKSESESSDNNSNEFETPLNDDIADPIWNTDSEEISKQKVNSSSSSSSSSEDDDDDDDYLDEDETIIANMILDDYDLDDFELSSLTTRFTKKSLTRQPDVPVLPASDKDIAAHLQSLWKRDRETKKQRKADREKARLLGILGNKQKSKGKQAKRAARREEMVRVDGLEGEEGETLQVDMYKINDEMRAFWDDDSLTEYYAPLLFSLTRSYALPPMNRFARKNVHLLARAYNFGSKSQGSGKMRYTTLFKTSKTSTMTLNEHKINGILKRASQVGPSERSGARWDSTSSSRAVKKHKDGDVVGGDAKEIASDNRGRVMLEKLGWRSGMGLGAEGMGMKVPVFAVVKAGKSGLQ
jgi:R3H domain/G-patch domain